MAQGHTSRDLTKAAVPNIKWAPNRTETESVAGLRYVGTLSKWKDFEQDVRATFNTHTWSSTELAWKNNPAPLDSDNVRCGNETGVVGRFQQHIGQVMTTVGLHTGMKLYFGDWHSRQPYLVPDLTIWDESELESLVVGEAKTPWTVHLRDDMLGAGRTAAEFLARFTRHAGQVAKYLNEFERKYGFLTTYEDTVFFKQEPYVINGNTINVLWYSNPISHKAHSKEVHDTTNVAAYKDMVSVRECMLYLMKVRDDPDWQTEKHNDRWVMSIAEARERGMKAEFLKDVVSDSSKLGDMLANPSKRKEHPTSSSSQGSKSGGQKQSYGKAPSINSYAHSGQKQQYSAKDLTAVTEKMHRLDINKLPTTPVQWNPRDRKFICPKFKCVADSYEKIDGYPIVLVKGRKYLGDVQKH